MKDLTKFISKINKRNKPLSVRRLRKYLKKLPPEAIIELRVNQKTKYSTDPIAFTGNVKRLGLGDYTTYGTVKYVVTLIAEREN